MHPFMPHRYMENISGKWNSIQIHSEDRCQVSTRSSKESQAKVYLGRKAQKGKNSKCTAAERDNKQLISRLKKQHNE